MLATVAAPQVQAGSELQVAPDSGSRRRTPRPCNCLRCNPPNGSQYIRCYRNNPQNAPPEPSDPEPFDPLIDTVSAAILNQEEKAKVWQYIQKHDQDRVLFLRDPAVVALIKSGATPLFPAELVQNALGYRL